MHAVQEGAANQSYGLAVAGLAGVPKSVIKNARRKLVQLENMSRNDSSSSETSIGIDTEQQLSLIPELSEAEQALAAIDPDELTPRQALDALYRLKQLV